jgi:hypothetical protein
MANENVNDGGPISSCGHTIYKHDAIAKDKEGKEFAIVCGEASSTYTGGLSLRDFFATQALGGLLAAPATSPHENYLGCAFNGYASADAIASDAYQLADAMLRARAALKGGGSNG